MVGNTIGGKTLNTTARATPLAALVITVDIRSLWLINDMTKEKYQIFAILCVIYADDCINKYHFPLIVGCIFALVFFVGAGWLLRKANAMDTKP
jgi:hypothetical protein